MQDRMPEEKDFTLELAQREAFIETLPINERHEARLRLLGDWNEFIMNTPESGNKSVPLNEAFNLG